MRKEAFFDAMCDIDAQYIMSAAPREGRRKPLAFKLRVAAVAACVLLIAGLMLPTLIKQMSHRDPIPFSYIDDIPAAEHVGQNSFSDHLRPLLQGSETVEISEDKICDFFNTDKILLEGLNGIVAYAGYEPWDELHDIKIRFLFDGTNGIDVIIDPKKKLLSHTNGSDNVASVGGFTVSKDVYYIAHDSQTGKPLSDFATVMLKIGRDDSALRLISDVEDSKELELVYNFLLNAEFDFSALKKKLFIDSLTYYFLSSDIPMPLVEGECEVVGEYLREPDGGSTVAHVAGNKALKFFECSESFIGSMLNEDLKECQAYVVYDSSDDIYSVSFVFDFGEKGKVNVKVDPETKFDLSAGDTVSINKYTVSGKGYYSLYGDPENAVKTMNTLAVNMQNDDVCVHICGDFNDMATIEKVMNFILYSDLNFEDLKK